MIQVSVVVPTYNRGAKLQSTLDSVLSQTLASTAWELIVIDDGSTNDTAAWAENYLRDVPNARVIRQPNGGVARARNRGWREARGEWVAFLDHDDAFHADKLERLLALATPQSGLLVPRWQWVDEKGQTVGESPLYNAPKSPFSWLFGRANPIVSMSVPLVRRNMLQRVGGFDPRAVPADDWDLWLRLARITKFVFTEEILVDYTMHQGQQSLDQGKMFQAVRLVLTKTPFAFVTRPMLLWWLLWSGAFVAALPAYEAAKEAGAPFLKSHVDAIKMHPLSILSPQWLWLWARKFTIWRD